MLALFWGSFAPLRSWLRTGLGFSEYLSIIFTPSRQVPHHPNANGNEVIW